MDSAVLSLTCAGLGAPEEDEDGGAVGYVKGEHCLGTPPTPTPCFVSPQFGSATRPSLISAAARGRVSADNLKDLQRLLRRDDPERREVFKQVCKWKIASRDLVPIIENYQADRNLVITAGTLFPPVSEMKL
jgi:timeless